MVKNPAGGAAKRWAVVVAGWLLIVLGIAALVLPGPGLLLLAGGLALLSQQYEWAERRLRPIETRAKRAAAESVQTVPRIAVSVLLAAVLAALGVLWVIDPPVPSWWPLAPKLWLLGGLWTGVTLVCSAVIALVTIVVSIRSYRGLSDAELERKLRTSIAGSSPAAE